MSWGGYRPAVPEVHTYRYSQYYQAPNQQLHTLAVFSLLFHWVNSLLTP
jgi:hypothetical protein